MLQQLRDDEIFLVYRALKRLIGVRDMNGLYHNNDHGHACYVEGANGIDMPGFNVERDDGFFRLLSAASKEMKRRKIQNSLEKEWTDLSNVRDFCNLVLKTYGHK